MVQDAFGGNMVAMFLVEIFRGRLFRSARMLAELRKPYLLSQLEQARCHVGKGQRCKTFTPGWRRQGDHHPAIDPRDLIGQVVGGELVALFVSIWCNPVCREVFWSDPPDDAANGNVLRAAKMFSVEFQPAADPSGEELRSKGDAHGRTPFQAGTQEVCHARSSHQTAFRLG